MKSLFLSLPLLVLCACQTAAEAGAVKQMHSMTAPKVEAPVAPASNEIVLQKIVGRLPEGGAKNQIFDCKITAKQLSDVSKVRSLIEQVSKGGMIEAYLFRAAEPSIEIYGFIGEQKIQIYEYASVLRYPKPSAGQELHQAGDHELISLTNSICPNINPEK